MKFSEHYNLSDFFSLTDRYLYQIDFQSILNLQTLCVRLLEPLYAHFGKPCVIVHGYLSAAACDDVLPFNQTASPHCTGQAVDFFVSGESLHDVKNYIIGNLIFDVMQVSYVHRYIHLEYNCSGENRCLVNN